MKTGTIPDRFSGEKIAEIYPRLANFIVAEKSPHLGRLHYFPGRALLDTDLQMEQAVRVQRLTLRGQAVEPGVVDGLEVSWAPTDNGIELRINPGQALTASGIDIIVDHTFSALIDNLKYFDLTTRTISEGFFGDLKSSESAAMTAVLLLQPWSVEDSDLPLAVRQTDNATDFTPCPRVPDDEVFYKTTETDAGRLVLYPLVDEPPGALWQNRAAWSVFKKEITDIDLPWQSIGVPLALIGFNDSLIPEWIDRHSVVRPAGRPRKRLLDRPDLDSRIWIAQFNQFCAQVAGLSVPLDASSLFHFIPPIGLLPKAYLTLSKLSLTESTPPAWNLRQSFFPSTYTIDISVIPTEQIDALIADTVRLAPYDLSHLDAVRFLLPVSQQWFDPDLLKIEIIDAAFLDTITRFRENRGTILASRYDLAQRRNALEISSTGIATVYPLSPDSPDPKRLETPEEPISPPPGDDLQYEVIRAIGDGSPSYANQLLADLRTTANGLLKSFTIEDFNEFKALFAACGLSATDRDAAFGSATAVPDWLKGFTVDPPIPTATGNLNAADQLELRKELLAYVVKQTSIQSDEADALNTSTLQSLIAYFTHKADEADELVDAGFLKARTDVFRLGTLLTNNSLGSKFSASPSLANIIERKPARANTDAVNTFASQLLANFAPSAIGANASTASSTASTSGTTSLRLLAKSSVPNQSLGALQQLSYSSVDQLSESASQLQSSSDAVTSLSDKISALSNLSPAERTAFDSLTSAAKTLGSSETIASLQGLATAGKFADSYVANFDRLSQKQLRAIPLDRLQPALAPTVRNEIHDGRLEIFERLTRLNISLGDLTTDFIDYPGRVTRPIDPSTVIRSRIRFQTLISRRQFENLDVIANPAAGSAVSDADESKHFSSGVSYADMAMAALRAVEVRIRDYRTFIEKCQGALEQSQTLANQITTVLARLDVDLDEARQDVDVAITLMKEEQNRLDGINAHREKVLNDHVEFLVYHRPRTVRLNTPVASRIIEPALTSEPVLDCLKENPTPPPDLATLRDIFQASPAAWFKYAPIWIGEVNHWDHLRGMLDRASRTTFPLSEMAPTLSSGRYSDTLGKIFGARIASSQLHLAMAKTILPASLVSLSWIDLHRTAVKQLTLGHLISAGPAQLSKAASQELHDLFAVATCLHENFCTVPGLTRLTWAERFGQFDQVSVDFRDLSRLPSWRNIEFTLRREIQILTDWLFGRINQDIPDAIDLINDLIRVALLLASHAPVDQLLVGQPLEPTFTVIPGGLIKLKVDPLRIRQGMDVFCKISDTQTLRATVEDIASTHVSARITEAALVNGNPIQVTSASTFYFKNASR